MSVERGFGERRTRIRASTHVSAPQPTIFSTLLVGVIATRRCLRRRVAGPQNLNDHLTAARLLTTAENGA